MNHKRRGIEKMKKSKPRNARRSIRLQGYDYSSPGSYFITMNTYQRKRLFGNIHKGVMVLSKYGNIAHQCWLNLAIKNPGFSWTSSLSCPIICTGLSRSSLIDLINTLTIQPYPCQLQKSPNMDRAGREKLDTVISDKTALN